MSSPETGRNFLKKAQSETAKKLITNKKLQEQPLHKAALGASKTYPEECPETNDTIPVPDSIPAIRTWQWQTIP